MKRFPRYWPFVQGIHLSPVNSLHKGQWRGALVFSLICAWINSWVSNREAGDLRCHHAHYDVIVMRNRCAVCNTVLYCTGMYRESMIFVFCLIEKTKYLASYVKNDFTWDQHMLTICENSNHSTKVLRGFRRVYPRGMLLRKVQGISTLQPKL